MFLDNFPTGYTPTESQKEIINEIESRIKSGYRNILVCAPTGIGKSHVAITVARSLGTSFVLTGQKILQDQYTRDFSWIYPMKGKGNFPCKALYEPLKLPYKKVINNEEFACDKGTCSWLPKGSKIREYCEFKPKKGQFGIQFKKTEKEEIIPPENMCYYYNQKYQALFASHSVFNYSSFFQTKKYSSGIEDLLEKKCLIADESHEIEGEIIRFIGYDIRKSHLEDVKWTFTPYDLEDTESMRKLVDDLYTSYIKEVKAMEEFKNPPAIMSKFKNREEKLKRLLDDMNQHLENFVVQPDNPDPAKTKFVAIKPLDIGQYVDEFFNYEIQIFLSATIEKKYFCKNMGFDEEKCALIEVPKSPFPLKNRTVEFCNIVNLNRSSGEKEWKKIYEKIDSIMKKHANEKGLILTSSILQCNNIKSNLPQESRDRLVFVFAQAGKQRDEVLKSHKDSDKPLVLLSPSLWVGVDLKDELSRFQIIVKTPYLSLSDKRIKTKMEKNYTWYMYETLTRLLQGLGRSVRHDKDFATTYVLDGTAEGLIKSMRKYVPKSYFEVFGWTT